MNLPLMFHLVMMGIDFGCAEIFIQQEYHAGVFKVLQYLNHEN